MVFGSGLSLITYATSTRPSRLHHRRRFAATGHAKLALPAESSMKLIPLCISRIRAIRANMRLGLRDFPCELLLSSLCRRDLKSSCSGVAAGALCFKMKIVLFAIFEIPDYRDASRAFSRVSQSCLSTIIGASSRLRLPRQLCSIVNIE